MTDQPEIPSDSVACPRCGGIGYVESKNVTLGDRVRSKRDMAQLTQAELASAVGLSRTQIANIEAGRSSITLDKIRAFSVALACPVGLLIP